MPPALVQLSEKSVGLAERAPGYSSKAGERVLDLCNGSGSTLIAAERTERRAESTEMRRRSRPLAGTVAAVSSARALSD